MTLTHDELQNSQTVSNLEECRRILDDISDVSWESGDVRDLVHRIDVVVADLFARLAPSDLNLIPRSVLQNLQPRTQEILSVLQTADSSRAAAHFNVSNVHGQLDMLLSESAQLPVVPIPTSDEALLMAAEQFRRTLDQTNEDIAKDIADARTQLDALASQISEKTAEIDTVAAEQKSSADATTAEFRDQMQALVSTSNEATERLGREVTSIQEAFRQSQGTRDAAFQDAQTSRDQQFHERVDSTVADVESYRDQARTMLEEVAMAGTSAHYAVLRNREEETANLWRKLAVGTLISLFVVAGTFYLIADFLDTEFTFEWMVVRSGVLLPLGALAAYTIRQSGEHRKRQEEMSRMANELQLLWPFLNRLPEQDRLAILREITPQYFTGGIPRSPHRGNPGLRERIRARLSRETNENEEN